MKTVLKVLRIVAGIFFAMAATSGLTKIAVSGSLFSYYGAGVCAAAAISWACLRPMKTVLRVLAIVIGIWFALWAVFALVVLIGAGNINSSYITAGPIHDVLFLGFLAYVCLHHEGKALVGNIRARWSRQAKPS